MSKKSNKAKRMTVIPTVIAPCVRPNVITLDNETFDRFVEKCVPIPNCPDGRFRPHSKAPGQKREPVKH